MIKQSAKCYSSKLKAVCDQIFVKTIGHGENRVNKILVSDWLLQRPPPRNCGSASCRTSPYCLVSKSQCCSCTCRLWFCSETIEQHIAGMSLSFEGKVVLVTGAGGGKRNSMLARLTLLLTLTLTVTANLLQRFISTLDDFQSN